MRSLPLLFLLLCVAAKDLSEENGVEGMETLVALNSPHSSEETEGEGEFKKARLTFFDTPTVKPPVRSEGMKLRYVAPKTTHAPKTTTTATESSQAATEATTAAASTTTTPAAATATSAATSAAPAATTTKTPVASTTTAAVKTTKKPVTTKKPATKKATVATTTPAAVTTEETAAATTEPTSTAAPTTTAATTTTTTTVAPTTTTTAAATTTTTHTPTTTAAPALTTSAATTAAPTTTTVEPSSTTTAATTPTTPADTTVAAAVEVEEKKKVEKVVKINYIAHDDSILMPIPPEFTAPKVAGVPTAVQGNPWGTEEVEKRENAPFESEFSIPIGSELDMGETVSPFLPNDSSPSPIHARLDQIEMNEEDVEKARLLMTALRAMKSEVEETLKRIEDDERTTLVTNESTTPLPPPTTTTETPTTVTFPDTTTTTPSSTPSPSSSPPPSSPAPQPQPPKDEVKSTEAILIDSDLGIEQTKFIPHNVAVVVVDNSATARRKSSSKRIEGYTRGVSRVVDSSWTKTTRGYSRGPHDNSFFPSEDSQFKAKILPKKRHIIESDHEGKKKKKRKLKRRYKKISPSTFTSTTVTEAPTTQPTPYPTLRPKSVTPRPSPPPLIQVAPAAVQQPQQPSNLQPLQLLPPQQLPQLLQQPPLARAAPIYRPPLYPNAVAAPQPQYYSPAPPPSTPIFYPPPPTAPSTPVFYPPTAPHPPIIRYEPVIYYQPVYGRKKRDALAASSHSFLFNREEKKVVIKKGSESRFSLLHSVISPSLRTKNRHTRVFEKANAKEVTVKKVEIGTKGSLPLPKSPFFRRTSFEPVVRTKRIKRGADVSESEEALPFQLEEEEERHSGLDELKSELEMIEKMKGKKEGEKTELIEGGVESEDEEEEEDLIPETEEEEEVKAVPSYKRPRPSIEELKALEDHLQVDHEEMKKHPQAQLRLNKGERPKLFSHGRTIVEKNREVELEAADYEYDAQIAHSFHLPATDQELEQIYNARAREADFAESSPTASPLRKRRRRRHRTTPAPQEEVEVLAATRHRSGKRSRTTPVPPTTQATTTPASTRRPRRRTRRPATLLPNFHPKDASSDSGSLSALPTLLPSEESETTTVRARGIRRNRGTTSSPTTTTTGTAEETTTARRRGRPAKVLPRKEPAFAVSAGENRFFYDRDSAPEAVTRTAPRAPPTLTPPPTLIPLQTTPTPISAALSVDELAVLPRDQLLEELKRLSDQLSTTLEEKDEEEREVESRTEAPPPLTPPPRDEEIVDEEDQELSEAIAAGRGRSRGGDGGDPFEFLNPPRREVTTTVPTTTTTEEDIFKFALPSEERRDESAAAEVVSDGVNESSIGNDLDRILADVGVGDNSVGTRKRAIEAIMEMKKRKANGESKSKASCQPTSCSGSGREELSTIPKDDYELVKQLREVNSKHPLAREGKFSLFATNKKSYYILPDGRVLVVNERSKIARTDSGEEIEEQNNEEEEEEKLVPQFPPEIDPFTTSRRTTVAPPTTVVTKRRRMKTTTPTPTTPTTVQPKKRTRRPTTTTGRPLLLLEDDDFFEDEAVQSTTYTPVRPGGSAALRVSPPEMKEVVLPWRSTTLSPPPSTTPKKRVVIHDGGIEPSQVSIFATPKTPPKSTIVVHKDEEKKHFPARTLENDLRTAVDNMTEELRTKYLESIDTKKNGEKGEENFATAVSGTGEDEYTDEQYEDSVVETERKPQPVSSQLNADPKSVDDIDLRQWFSIGKDDAARRTKKGDALAESILEAASEVPDEEVAEDEFLAAESVDLFPEDFVRVLRSVAGGERVPMRLLRRLGLRLRAARL